MSITDELREWLRSLYTPNGGTLKRDGEHIADRIDAEHERACAEAYGNGAMSVPVALDESAWVELPKDAHGEYIRVGDVMEHRRPCVKSPATVDRIELWEVGGHYLWTIRLDTGDESHEFSGCELRHHRAQTVEDVLREFASECLTYATCVDDHEVADAIELYAAKLQLKEE